LRQGAPRDDEPQVLLPGTGKRSERCGMADTVLAGKRSASATIGKGDRSMLQCPARKTGSTSSRPRRGDAIGCGQVANPARLLSKCTEGQLRSSAAVLIRFLLFLEERTGPSAPDPDFPCLQLASFHRTHRPGFTIPPPMMSSRTCIRAEAACPFTTSERLQCCRRPRPAQFQRGMVKARSRRYRG